MPFRPIFPLLHGSAAALPTDGISTTYWPYQLAVTDTQIAIATNTGAVVVDREE